MLSVAAPVHPSTVNDPYSWLEQRNGPYALHWIEAENAPTLPALHMIYFSQTPIGPAAA